MIRGPVGRLSGFVVFKRGISTANAKVPLLLGPSEYLQLPGPTPLVPLDVSWHMPGSGRQAKDEFQQKRIPRARFLDLDAVASSHPLNLPHMMPSSMLFAQACSQLGISPKSHVVLYDTIGVFSAPRALFMFKTFGHDKVSILDGGLRHWEAKGLPTEDGPANLATNVSDYPLPQLNKASLRSYEQIQANAATSPSSDKNVELVLDARAAPRYHGTAPEPRLGLSSGHIPHSISLPFTLLLENHGSGDKAFTTLRQPEELRRVFVEALGSEDALQAGAARRVVNTCGSGMTAAIIWLALQRLGVDSALYDESWMGYAARPESIIAKT